MTPWVKMDDDHPVNVDLELGGDDAAGWMHFAAICYCSRHLTDGFISDAAVAKLTNNRNWKKTRDRLIEAGWFIRVDGGVQVRHYTDRQSTKAEVEAQREANRDRKRRSRAAAGHTGEGHAVTRMSHRDKRDHGIWRPTVTHSDVTPPIDTDIDADTDNGPDQPIELSLSGSPNSTAVVRAGGPTAEDVRAELRKIGVAA